MHLLPQWVEIANHMRFGVAHALHFVVPQSIESVARDAMSELDAQKSFESTHIHVMDMEPVGGWPIAPNAHFYHAAMFMMQDNPGIPWLLCELDCRPFRENALDIIAAKYGSCGTPFFGNVDKTPWRSDAGKIVPSMHGPQDVMMSGCGVYPGNLPVRANIKALFDDFLKGGDSTDEAFDLHLRSGMRADGITHSELIAQKWNTENYRVDGTTIICDSRKTHEIFDQHPTWEIRMCGGPIHVDAVMIHGCKDESLTNLILSNAIPAQSYRPAKIVVVNPGMPQAAVAEVPVVVPAESPRITALENRMDAMMGLLEKMAANSATQRKEATDRLNAPYPRADANPVANEGGATCDVFLIEPKPTELDAILAQFPDEKRKFKMTDVSKATGIELARVKQIVSENPSLFRGPDGPAGWFGRAAA